MSYSNQALAYREREVAAATPGRLVVMVYDHVLANMARAGVAHANNLPEARLEAIAKARDGVAELLGTLDMEKGGAIAQQLQSIYVFVLSELSGIGMKFDERKVGRLANVLRELRDAFATIATDSARTTAA
jgi:flagellar protein FliS